MKTKTVTIHNWDGSKYDVEAPANARWLGILSALGTIRFYSQKPKANPREFSKNTYYENSPYFISDVDNACPDENLPIVDGYTGERLFKIEEV